MVKEAIQEGAKIHTIVICEEALEQTSMDHQYVYDIARNDCLYVSAPVFKSLTDVTNPQGILTVVEKKSKQEEISYQEDVVLVLDGIQDPGNMGTIIRTADSVGMKQILLSKGCADVYNPKVIRSTMGAIFRVNVIECTDLTKTLQDLKNQNYQIVATDLKTKHTIYQMVEGKKAIVIGNEANGVSHDILKMADQKVKIPMFGKTESLNASVATGVILYECVRRKTNYKKSIDL